MSFASVPFLLLRKYYVMDRILGIGTTKSRVATSLSMYKKDLNFSLAYNVSFSICYACIMYVGDNVHLKCGEGAYLLVHLLLMMSVG